MEQPTGDEVLRLIAAETDTVLLAFSCGKDSIAAWLACRQHFRRIIPYYMYLVPDLEFVETSLKYYEEFFGERIIRVPHESLYRMLQAGVFQPPERAAALDAWRARPISYRKIQDEIRARHGLASAAMVASGVRAVDSPYRMIAMRKHGPINRKKGQFMPVWDWRKERLLSAFRESRVRLPVDYEMFGRSFDGIDYRFLRPLQDRFPRDYEKILRWFPLAEAEIRRREYAEVG